MEKRTYLFFLAETSWVKFKCYLKDLDFKQMQIFLISKMEMWK